jgi:flavin-dependent dehydrogenase
VPVIDDTQGDRSCDVLVVGGGPSGSACAYWLASASQ